MAGIEGGKDRPGQNHLIKKLLDANWNYHTNKWCKKVQLINKTGVPSVYGEIVETSTTTDFAFQVNVANSAEMMGVVYEAGIADGSICWIVVGGSAQVLLEDATAATHGFWARNSITVAGRADITNASPPGGGVAAIDRHFREIGHSIETVVGGTDVLAEIMVHFN